MYLTLQAVKSALEKHDDDSLCFRFHTLRHPNMTLHAILSPLNNIFSQRNNFSVSTSEVSVVSLQEKVQIVGNLSMACSCNKKYSCEIAYTN